MPDVGQVCIASSRVLVQESVAEKFRSYVKAEVSSLVQGAPDDKATRLGPQADARQVEAITSFLEVGRKEGKLLVGGEPAKDLGVSHGS